MVPLHKRPLTPPPLPPPFLSFWLRSHRDVPPPTPQLQVSNTSLSVLLTTVVCIMLSARSTSTLPGLHHGRRCEAESFTHKTGRMTCASCRSGFGKVPISWKNAENCGKKNSTHATAGGRKDLKNLVHANLNP